MSTESCGLLRKPCRYPDRHTKEEKRRKSRSEKRWAARRGSTRDSITITECIAVAEEPITACHAEVE